MGTMAPAKKQSDQPNVPSSGEGVGDAQADPAPELVESPIAPIQTPPPSPVVTHRVLRNFHAAGFDRLPGELVDASWWRTTKSLEVMRYITPVESIDTDPIPTSDGRLWADLEVAMKHEDTLLPTS